MKNVTIYSQKTCPYCVKAKQLLDSKGVKYEELLVDEKPDLLQEAIDRSGGMKTVPQIFIENHHVGGCDDLHALEKEGKLDELLGK